MSSETGTAPPGPAPSTTAPVPEAHTVSPPVKVAKVAKGPLTAGSTPPAHAHTFYPIETHHTMSHDRTRFMCVCGAWKWVPITKENEVQ